MEAGTEEAEGDRMREEMLPNGLLSSRAVLYVRVSSKEQEREGYSIPAQCKLLRFYARRHDYQVVREFIDVETAKQSGRTRFTEMVRFLEEHPQVRIVLCEKTDWLYRNFKDYVTIDELDLTLIFVKEGSVLNKDSQEKAEEGELPAYAPLGYLHDKTIELDPQRAPIIRQTFEQYATRKCSIRRLFRPSSPHSTSSTEWPKRQKRQPPLKLPVQLCSLGRTRTGNWIQGTAVSLRATRHRATGRRR